LEIEDIRWESRCGTDCFDGSRSDFLAAASRRLRTTMAPLYADETVSNGMVRIMYCGGRVKPSKKSVDETFWQKP
jgi:hypothetical protein